MVDIENDLTARLGKVDAEVTAVLQGRAVVEVRETETRINIVLENKSDRNELSTVIALTKPVTFKIDRVGYEVSEAAADVGAGAGAGTE